jgi:hypothetical protein
MTGTVTDTAPSSAPRLAKQPHENIYLKIYQEHNKCICKDVNAVANEWWILEVLVGLRAVCCTSFPNDSYQCPKTTPK